MGSWLRWKPPSQRRASIKGRSRCRCRRSGLSAARWRRHGLLSQTFISQSSAPARSADSGTGGRRRRRRRAHRREEAHSPQVGPIRRASHRVAATHKRSTPRTTRATSACCSPRITSPPTPVIASTTKANTRIVPRGAISPNFTALPAPVVPQDVQELCRRVAPAPTSRGACDRRPERWKSGPR